MDVEAARAEAQCTLLLIYISPFFVIFRIFYLSFSCVSLVFNIIKSPKDFFNYNMKNNSVNPSISPSSQTQGIPK